MPARRQKPSISGLGRSCTSSVSMRAKSQAVRVVQSSAPCSAWNQPARPIWSGWWWVTITRATGRPRSGPASSRPQSARIAAVSMPVSTSVQPSPSSSA